jgi:monoamine oxidase
MPGSDVEVVVVGGGAAGVAAARRLREAGIDCLIVEARGRLGGRAWTISDESGFSLDLGCGWLHSADRNPWVKIAQEQEAAIDKSRPPWARAMRDIGFPHAEQREFQHAMDAFFARVERAAAGANDVPAGDSLEPGCRWNGLIDAISTYISGAEWGRVSAKDYDRYHDTGVNWRVVKGYGALISACGESFPAALDCEVRAIDHRGKRLRIETAKGAIAADQVIVTIPSALLAAERLLFTPALPEKIAAARPRRQIIHRPCRRRGIRAGHAGVRTHRSCGHGQLSLPAVRATDDRGLFRRSLRRRTGEQRRRRVF